MNIHIDDDTADSIVADSLKASIDRIKPEIARLKKTKNLPPHHKQDLADAVIDLGGLEIAYNYYGGNTE